MSKFKYIPPERKITADFSAEIDSDVLNNDIDFVDYSKYREDDSDEEMARLLGY